MARPKTVRFGDSVYRVRTVSPSVLRDYDGLNFYSARQLGFRPVPAKDEVLIASDSSNPKATIKHEVVEAELMKRGADYWSAHKAGLEAEKRP